MEFIYEMKRPGRRNKVRKGYNKKTGRKKRKG